jgi:metal-responsive CopG/Arc/MetJ family transcriptional regulator
MGAISLRLPEQLERKLGLEARLSGQPRSQLLREALEDLLSRRERERSLAELVAAAEALVADPEAIEESLALAHDFALAESEALAQAEASASTTGLDDGATPWWR